MKNSVNSCLYYSKLAEKLLLDVTAKADSIFNVLLIYFFNGNGQNLFLVICTTFLSGVCFFKQFFILVAANDFVD